jgi:hypothetical protein
MHIVRISRHLAYYLSVPRNHKSTVYHTLKLEHGHLCSVELDVVNWMDFVYLGHCKHRFNTFESLCEAASILYVCAIVLTFLHRDAASR